VRAQVAELSTNLSHAKREAGMATDLRQKLVLEREQLAAAQVAIEQLKAQLAAAERMAQQDVALRLQQRMHSGSKAAAPSGRRSQQLSASGCEPRGSLSGGDDVEQGSCRQVADSSSDGSGSGDEGNGVSLVPDMPQTSFIMRTLSAAAVAAAAAAAIGSDAGGTMGAEDDSSPGPVGASEALRPVRADAGQMMQRPGLRDLAVAAGGRGSLRSSLRRCEQVASRPELLITCCLARAGIRRAVIQDVNLILNQFMIFA
jgi:hypothetical protein